jgi:Tfp pilus assembly protein FimT
MIKFQRNQNMHTPRSAFTLIELLLVLSIMFVVVSLATPSINNMFQRTALDRGADRVRAAMGEARVKAIKEGDVYAVFVARGRNWFDMGPFANSKNQISRANRDQDSVSQYGNSGFEDNRLPNGITFAAGEVLSDARAAEVLAGTGGSGGEGLQQILFYPDGTSQDASIVMTNEIGGIVEIQLRGLTGLSKTVRLKEMR